MLTLVDNTNANSFITPKAHGLYKLSLLTGTQVAIESKPVFGANITLHCDALQHANFIAQPSHILGWLDHGGLSYFSINQSSAYSASDATERLSPSRFFSADGGILRVTSATRVYLIATSAQDILHKGLCFFTPV